MSNKTNALIVILSAMFLSACTAVSPTGKPEQPGETNTQEDQSEQSLSTSMRDLLGMGTNQKCKIYMSEIDSENIKTETMGDLYVSGKRMAEEISMTSTDKNRANIDMRMISDGTYMYTWDAKNVSQGMKIKITEPVEAGNAEKGNNQNGGVDMDKKVDMKCSPWIVDESKFAIPKEVKFTDLTEMMKNIPTMPANIPSGE